MSTSAVSTLRRSTPPHRSMKNIRLPATRSAATARGRLLELASETLGVERSSLQVEDGLVTSLATNRSVTYWELMEGRPFALAIDPAVSLKSPRQYRQIGRQVLAKDLIELVRGGA